SRQPTRLRPPIQFLALLRAHWQQPSSISHVIETQLFCFMYHWDEPLGASLNASGYKIWRIKDNPVGPARLSFGTPTRMT
ncbi:MAG TPA: hypothetical protein VH601_02685, partial [Bryobacteraceae bacterium]